MTDLLDRVVAALRLNHDLLVTLVPNLGPEQLGGPSGAAEWDVVQVLSHLGSGAELNGKPVARAAGRDVVEEDNQSVWARWDHAAPVDQVAAFVQHEGEYVELAESLARSLSEEQRTTMTVQLGFLPEPVPLVTALGLRLNEMANHGWDVRAGLDPSAEVDEQSAAVLLELFQGPLAFLLDFSGKADQLDRDVRLAVPGGGIEVTDRVAVVDEVSEPTATLSGERGAVVRLISGRLRPPYDEGVTVEGDVSLDDLRRVFPGY